MRAGLLWLIGLVSALALAACHEGSEVRVADLRFEGNAALSDGELARILATRETGFLPWSEPRVFSRTVFEADLKRLVAFYGDRGYPDARVTGADVAFTDNGQAVNLAIHIDEGEPVRIEAVQLTGMPAGIPLSADDLPIAAGDVADTRAMLAASERVGFVLRDHGYPDAAVDRTTVPGTADRSIVFAISATPGALATFGDVRFVGLDAVEAGVVERTLAFEPGGQYRESQVLESQRRLFDLGLFDFAHVAADRDAKTDATVRPMVVTVKEGRPSRLQFGVGWGTEDGPRASLEWQHRNFGGGARQFGLDGRYSKRLSGLGLTFTQPHAGGRAFDAGVVAGAFWESETIYTSERQGLSGNLTWRRQVGRGLDVAPIDRMARVSYTFEALRYAIAPEARDDLSNADELIALGLDPTTASGSGRLMSLSLDFEQTVVDQPIDPRLGYSVAAHFETAAPVLGGTFDFREVQLAGRVYVPVGASIVWASRARAGALIASSDDELPFSARYFLGGSTSLRGWGRFEVSPLSEEGLPIGGRALLEVSSELRVPVRGRFSVVGFVDAGNAWSVGKDIRINDLRVSVGSGVRWLTTFGALRGDVGYQLNPIAGLLVDGEPQARRWRVHLSFGHAF